MSAWANWRLNLSALSEEFRVLAPDIVGFGFTERPPSVSCEMETWKRHLLGFIDSLGLPCDGLAPVATLGEGLEDGGFLRGRPRGVANVPCSLAGSCRAACTATTLPSTESWTEPAMRATSTSRRA